MRLQLAVNAPIKSPESFVAIFSSVNCRSYPNGAKDLHEEEEEVVGKTISQLRPIIIRDLSAVGEKNRIAD